MWGEPLVETTVRPPENIAVSLARAKDNAEVSPGIHDTNTNPFHRERRTLCRFRINLYRVPHEKEGHKRFEFPIRKMPGERGSTRSTKNQWIMEGESINPQTFLHTSTRRLPKAWNGSG